MDYLTERQEQLLNTDFGADMEKKAHEIVEMEKVASDCITYGYELAMQKIAELEEKAAKGEDDEEKEEEEKTASAMGQIILDSYWSTLMEKGAEFYGDSDIYIDKIAEGAPGASGGALKSVLDVINPMNIKKNVTGAFAKGDMGFKGRAGAVGKGLGALALPAAGIYGAKKLYDRSKKKKEQEPQY